MANTAEVFQGQNDSPLSEQGWQQAEMLASELACFPVGAVYSSPLSRASETARLIASKTGAVLKQDDRLKELNVGELTGRPYTSIATDFPDLFASFRRDPVSVRFPAGETLTELAERATASISQIISETGDEGTVVIVAHNMCLRAMTLQLLGLPLLFIRQLALDTAAYSIISIPQGGRPILVSWNQTAHLGKPPKLLPGGLLGL